MAAKRNSLGKGLAALIRDAADQDVATDRNAFDVLETKNSTMGGGENAAANQVSYLPLAELRTGRFQPREYFDEEAIKTLAQSIRQSGMIQPILVRPMGDQYEIIAGERRFRAAQQAQLHHVPVIVRRTDDEEALQIALVENLQREQLNPIEEARGLMRLQKEFGYDQGEIANMIGKSRSHIANMIRLLSLPEKILTLIQTGKLSAGHGRALLSAPNPFVVAEKIIQKNLSVRQVELLAKNSAVFNPRTPPKANAMTPDHRAFVEKLSSAIGLPVELHHKTSGAGELRIRYRELAQLEYLAKKLLPQ